MKDRALEADDIADHLRALTMVNVPYTDEMIAMPWMTLRFNPIPKATMMTCWPAIQKQLLVILTATLTN